MFSLVSNWVCSRKMAVTVENTEFEIVQDYFELEETEITVNGRRDY